MDELVSIIIPVSLDMDKPIRLIDSIINQTYHNWELLIVSESENGEKDTDIEDASLYSDNRIRWISAGYCNGCDFILREKGVYLSSGKWVVTIDAECNVDCDYIENGISMLIQSGAEICISRSGKSSGVVGSKEAFISSLQTDNAGYNGSFVKKALYDKSLKNVDNFLKYFPHMYDNYFRILLLYTEKKISYISNVISSGSDSNRRISCFNIESYERGISNKWMKSVVMKKVSADIDFMKALEIFDMKCYQDALYKYAVTNVYSYKTKAVCKYLIRKWHDGIDFDIIHESHLSNLLPDYRKSLIKMTLKALANGDIRLRDLNKILSEHIYNHIGILKWNAQKKLNKNYRETIINKRERYKYPDDQSCVEDYVICAFDGLVNEGGLADRLRGILSTYYICKKCNRKFKLLFISPFMLTDYLIPSLYDWKIDTKEINYNESEIVTMSTISDDLYLKRKQYRYLAKKIRDTKTEMLVYANPSFVYDCDYGRLFAELFRPSDTLLKSINKQKSILGKKYISISCRFMDIIGDFNETCERGYKLTNYETIYLFQDLMDKVEELHKEYPDCIVLVNSDSKTFLEYADKEQYTYVIPGNITHIDAENKENQYYIYEKTFVDFFMIAEAEKIYLLKTDFMYNSGFPYAASKIYNRPFERIDL